MNEKLLTNRELRFALAGRNCPFTIPPAPASIRDWVKRGLKFHVLPGGKRKLFKLSEALAFLNEHPEAVA